MFEDEKSLRTPLRLPCFFGFFEIVRFVVVQAPKHILAKSVLAELPDQLVSYFRHRRMRPMRDPKAVPTQASESGLAPPPYSPT